MIEDRLRKLEEKPAAIEERIEFKVDQLKFNDPVVKVVQGALEGALRSSTKLKKSRLSAGNRM